MKFQICTCGKHLFVHGNFFNENGPLFRGEGLEHLSGDMFSQTDTRTFIQSALDAGKITLEEACELGRDQAIRLLPETRPSGLALYQKNGMALIERLELTPKGKQNVTDMLVADSNATLHALNSFASKILGAFGLWTFLFLKKTPRKIAKEQLREIKRRNSKKNKKASPRND